MTEVSIEFDKRSLSYLPGEIVSGVVVITCSSEQVTRGLQIAFLGEANTHAFTRSKKKVKQNSVGPEVTEEYEYERFYGPYQGTETIICKVLHDLPDLFSLKQGRDKFPFSFTLPMSIPCSFEGECGHITYGIDVDIKTSLSSQPDKTRKEIQVVAICDLNSDPTVLKFAEDTKNRTRSLCESLYSCKCKNKDDPSFTAKLKVYRTGFCIGESILFRCELTNTKRRKVKVYNVSLNQIIRYRANDGTCMPTTQLIVDAERPRPGGLDALFNESTDLWEGMLDPIPTVPPSKLGGVCEMITVDYELILRLTFKPASNDLCIRISVSIGTIPLPPQSIPSSSMSSRTITNQPSTNIRSDIKGKHGKDEEKWKKKDERRLMKEDRRSRNAERRKKKSDKRKWEEDQKKKKPKQGK